MRQRREWLFLLLAGFGVLWIFAANASGPSYEGKSVSYWFQHGFEDFDDIGSTIKAFKAMGSNAVPYLIEMLERKPGLPEDSKIENQRGDAAFLIAQIGPEAAAAIPALLRIPIIDTNDWQLRTSVRVALCAMGEKLSRHAPAIVEWLQSSDGELRELGRHLLVCMGPKAREAAPLLVKALKRSDASVSLALAEALWSVARDTNAVLAVYTRALQSTNPVHREFVLCQLAEMGVAARTAGPAIEALLENPDRTQRQRAEIILYRIAPGLLQARSRKINNQLPAELEELMQAIRSSERPVRFRALDTIPLLGSNAVEAVPALVRVLTDAPPSPSPGPMEPTGGTTDHRQAAECLGEIGPGAMAATAALVQALKARPGPDRFYFCRALGDIGPGARESVPALAEALQDQNRRVRLAAATAIVRIAPAESSNAVEVLEALKWDLDGALVLASTNGIPQKSTLKDGFGNFDGAYPRLAASVALWQAGLAKDPPVAEITGEFGKDASLFDSEYIELLGEIGPAAKSALLVLEPYLNPGNYYRLRIRAAIAIRKIDPEEAAKLNLPGVLLRCAY